MTRTQYLIANAHRMYDRAAASLSHRRSLKDHPHKEPPVTSQDIAKEAVQIVSALADALGLED